MLLEHLISDEILIVGVGEFNWNVSQIESAANFFNSRHARFRGCWRCWFRRRRLSFLLFLFFLLSTAFTGRILIRISCSVFFRFLLRIILLAFLFLTAFRFFFTSNLALLSFLSFVAIFWFIVIVFILK